MYICVCKQITDQELHDAIEEGEVICLADLVKLQIAQRCGKCKLRAEEVATELFYNLA